MSRVEKGTPFQFAEGSRLQEPPLGVMWAAQMISIEDAIERLGLEQEEVIEFLDDFLGYGREDLAGIREALARRDHEAVAKRAHSIKGASSNLSLDSVSATAAAIEAKARNEDLEGAAELAERLAGQIDEVAAYLADTFGT